MAPEGRDDPFPRHRWPAKSNIVFSTSLAVLAALALLVFGLSEGWFDRQGRSHAEQVEAEIAALQGSESQRPGAVQPRRAVPRATPQAESVYQGHRLAIEFGLLGLAIVAPFVLLIMLICLFSRRLRVPGFVGLVLGLVAANVGGQWFMHGNLSRWGLLQTADSMGAVFQFAEVVAASFTMGALVGAVASLAVRRARRRPSATHTADEPGRPRADSAGGET